MNLANVVKNVLLNCLTFNMLVKQINTMRIFFNVRSNPKHFLALNVFGFDLFVVPWKKLKAITITNIANYLNLVYLKTAINGKSTWDWLK